MKLRQMPNWFATALLVAVVLLIYFTPQAQARYVLGTALAFATALCCFFYACMAGNPADALDSGYPDLPDVPLDPWAMQRTLMQASDQQLPDAPALTKGSLMYSALILEEGHEIFRDGVVPALDRLLAEVATAGRWPHLSDDSLLGLRTIRGRLRLCALQMAQDSKIIRQHLKTLPDFNMTMTVAEAIGTFDGTTDLAVVNCGFALSCGLDGAEGYVEVATSNLSKRNPETGRIDKEPDGKWIKGPDYREPDLERVFSNALR